MASAEFDKAAVFADQLAFHVGRNIARPQEKPTAEIERTRFLGDLDAGEISIHVAIEAVRVNEAFRHDLDVVSALKIKCWTERPAGLVYDIAFRVEIQCARVLNALER